MVKKENLNKTVCFESVASHWKETKEEIVALRNELVQLFKFPNIGAVILAKLEDLIREEEEYCYYILRDGHSLNEALRVSEEEKYKEAA